jgi:hypothetical protein
VKRSVARPGAIRRRERSLTPERPIVPLVTVTVGEHLHAAGCAIAGLPSAEARMLRSLADRDTTLLISAR